MIGFLKSKSFLITTILISLLFIMNVGVTDSAPKEIVLAVLKSILAGTLFGIVVGGIVYLVSKRIKN